jgi:uncharacterized damage-inducible protein DinB
MCWNAYPGAEMNASKGEKTMNVKSLLGACCVLLCAAPLAAQQSAAGATDSISGSWTGSMGPSEADRHPIHLELKFDGTAAVTGTITGPPAPGEIKTGTFDPKTGALKLEVWVKDAGGNVALFDGTVAQSMATGRVLLGNQNGTFQMTKKGAGGAVAGVQAGSGAAAALREGFGEVSGYVSKAAELVPADKYTYQPTKSTRTFGQLIGHIADGYAYFCAAAGGKKVEWSDGIEKGGTDKATLVKKLKQTTDSCHAAYGGAGQVGELLKNVSHTNLHYGNIITYMRLLGLVPPSS